MVCNPCLQRRVRPADGGVVWVGAVSVGPLAQASIQGPDSSLILGCAILQQELTEQEKRAKTPPPVLKRIQTPSVLSGRATNHIYLFLQTREQKDKTALFYELGHAAFAQFFQKTILRAQILVKIQLTNIGPRKTHIGQLKTLRQPPPNLTITGGSLLSGLYQTRSWH